MFDQTPLNRLNGINWGGEKHHTDAHDGGGVRRLLADISELAELQARLLASDARCLLASLIKPAILGAVGLAILLGTVPILVLAGADALVQQLAWSPPLAKLAAAGVAILVAAGLAGIAVVRIRRCGPPLLSSLSEFEKNMETLREMLTGKNALAQHWENLERRGRAK